MLINAGSFFNVTEDTVSEFLPLEDNYFDRRSYIRFARIRANFSRRYAMFLGNIARRFAYLCGHMRQNFFLSVSRIYSAKFKTAAESTNGSFAKFCGNSVFLP